MGQRTQINKLISLLIQYGEEIEEDILDGWIEEFEKTFTQKDTYQLPEGSQ